MKYVLQIVGFFITTFLFIFFSFIQHGIPFISLENPMAWVNGVMFALCIPMFVFVYISLMQKELIHRRICYTLAEWLCVLGIVGSGAMCVMTFLWLFGAQFYAKYVPSLNLGYKFTDALIWVIFILTGQLIYVLFIGKSLPFLNFIEVKPKKPIGQYMLDDLMENGFTQEEAKKMVEKAYQRQQDDIGKI